MGKSTLLHCLVKNFTRQTLTNTKVDTFSQTMVDTNFTFFLGQMRVFFLFFSFLISLSLIHSLLFVCMSVYIKICLYLSIYLSIYLSPPLAAPLSLFIHLFHYQLLQGPVTVTSGKKRRITLMECNNDINSMIDIAKVGKI